MKIPLVLILSIWAFTIFGQDIELLRQKGYEAKINGNVQIAIDYYKDILVINSEDYDAKLAVANLYFTVQKIDSALNYYSLIYVNDPTDIEAINGFGRCYSRQENFTKSAFYFNKSIQILPTYIPPYFDLAQVYISVNELDSAVLIYKKILDQDSTYAEAFAGLGKMNYWKNEPYTAAAQYEKALQLDPENETYQSDLQTIKNLTSFSNELKFLYVNENESNYRINAIMGKYFLSKRINNHWNASLSLLLDHSNRDFYEIGADTTRWFDNLAFSLAWLGEKTSVNGYIGYSNSDKTLTAYGVSWSYTFYISNIKIINTLNGGYEYFFYWNRVGRNKISDNLQINYKKWKFEGNFLKGVVTENLVDDFYNDLYGFAENPHTMYSLSLSYQLSSSPKVTVYVNHSFLDYTYKSPLYYTPYERKLTGPSASIYYSKKGFYIYSFFAYNIGSELFYEEIKGSGQRASGFKVNKQDINSWNMDAEIGYNKNRVSISGGVSKFYNPYYENFISFLTIKAQL